MSVPGEILMELHHSGETPSRCVDEAGDELKTCDLCHRQIRTWEGTQVEPDLFVCHADHAEYSRAVADVLDADRWFQEWIKNVELLRTRLRDESQPAHMRIGWAMGFGDELRRQLQQRLIGRKV